MQPLPDRVHIITFTGSPENEFQTLYYKPFLTHAEFVERIAHYRLPPPKFWRILDTDSDELRTPQSPINRTIDSMWRTKGDGAAVWLNAAMRELLPTEALTQTLKRVYEIDTIQYPGGYAVFHDKGTYPLYNHLEMLDLIHLEIDSSHTFSVTHTTRGQLAYEALLKISEKESHNAGH